MGYNGNGTPLVFDGVIYRSMKAFCKHLSGGDRKLEERLRGLLNRKWSPERVAYVAKHPEERLQAICTSAYASTHGGINGSSRSGSNKRVLRDPSDYEIDTE